MSTLVAGAALATAMLSNCSWNHPGRNPYRGTIGEAVSRYVDIPEATRQALVAKMTAGQADDAVTITRDAIQGKFAYQPGITAMHFGQRTVCDYVTRSGWSDKAREPAAVYCVGDECLIVPKICGNVSRVRRTLASTAGGGGAAGGGGGYGGPGAPDMVSPAAASLPGRIASPDDVAMADAMAQASSSSAGADTALLASSSFMSPFGQSGRLLGSRAPETDTGLAPTSPVPEPATYGMLGAGLAVLAALARRRASKPDSE